MVLHDEKVIFLHVPKTAGISIEYAMTKKAMNHKVFYYWDVWRPRRYKINIQHALPFEIKRTHGMKRWDQYFKFAFVRNPWARFVSLYAHLQNVNILDKNITFPQFADYFCGGRKGGMLPDDHANMALPASEWTEGADFVGKMESIDTDFAAVCEKLGRKWKLPHFNKSPHAPYQTYYDEETKNRVAKYYEKDIDHFKYTFDS